MVKKYTNRAGEAKVVPSLDMVAMRAYATMVFHYSCTLPWLSIPVQAGGKHLKQSSQYPLGLGLKAHAFSM